MGIRMLALSDIHGKISSLSGIMAAVLPSQKIDLITISGDISNFGTELDLRQILGVVEKSGIPFCYILGNCDPPEHRDGVGVKGKCLQSSCTDLPGLRIVGAGASTATPFGTPFEMSEDEIADTLLRNRAHCTAPEPEALMFMVHNPPAGSTIDRTMFGQHVGSRRLKDLILEHSPTLVQCGHIHEGTGIEQIGRSVAFNPGPAMKGRYAIVEIGGREANVTLGKV
jgi:Icc-related predicted phosphoesterase